MGCEAGSLVAQAVKNPPAVQETRIWFLGQEIAQEKGMATHRSILAWRIPWTEEPSGLPSMGLKSLRQDWETNTLTSLSQSRFRADFISY